MRFALATPILIVASFVCLADAAKSGIRGEGDRKLVQGGSGQVPCEPDGSNSCTWGRGSGANVKRFWVEHPNVFWRCSQPGMIALTFDDGPSDNMAPVLDELKKLDVIATFFINGVNIVNRPDIAPLLTRAEAEGHVVAHHTYGHERSSKRVEFDEDGNVTPETEAWFEKEIERNIARAEPYLPIYGLRPYFRPPFLDLDEATSTYLETKYNIYVVQLNADTRDYEGIKSSEVIAAEINSNIYEDSSVHSWVTLQHDKVNTTAAAIPRIVSYGKEFNYKFVGIDECLNFPKEARMDVTLAPTITPCEGEPCEKTFQCRSEFGFCGVGPKFCNIRPQFVPKCLTGGIEVQFNCSATACPEKNMCRSSADFCGIGSEYCNEGSVWVPGCSPATAAGITMGVLTILSGVTAMLM